MLRYRIKTFTVRTAWVRDIIDYAKGDSLPSRPLSYGQAGCTRRKRFHIEYVGRSLHPISIKTGAEWSHFRSQVPGYAHTPVTENRTEAFVLSRWQVIDRLTVSANFRQALITGYNPPFSPSLGPKVTRLW